MKKADDSKQHSSWKRFAFIGFCSCIVATLLGMQAYIHSRTRSTDFQSGSKLQLNGPKEEKKKGTGSDEQLESQDSSDSFPTPFETRRDLAMVESSTTAPSARGTLLISIISNNRLASLQRLSNSLLVADYTGSRDFFSSINLVLNLEASSELPLLQYAMKLEWPHGSKQVRKRLKQGGLVTAVSESWFPSSFSEYGLILEDDIEVSPLYIQWVIKALAMHSRQRDPRLVGISLYSPRVTETVKPKKPFDSTQLMQDIMGDSESPYLMQTPCSWGAVYFPQPWTEFLGFMQLRLELMESENVDVPRSRTNGWKESWKRFHFEFLYLRGLYLMYPNFLGQASLSTNHLEPGTHIGGVATVVRENDFKVPLLTSAESLQRLNLERKLSELPVFDVFGEQWNSAETFEEYFGALQRGNSSAAPEVNAAGSTEKLTSFVSRHMLSINMTTKRSAPKTSDDRRKKACENFPVTLNSFFKDLSTFTLMISTFDRFELVSKQLLYYSASPLISTIIVVWHNSAVPPPKHGIVQGTYVRFEVPSTNTLNNRFVPLATVTTECVMIIDDDMRIHLQDLANLLEAWKHNPRNVVGFMPRWLDRNVTARIGYDHESLVYRQESEDPFHPNKQPHKGYSLVLTKALMVHRDFLKLYTCGGESKDIRIEVSKEFDEMRRTIHRIVDSRLNCEDIGLNFVANAALHTIGKAAPLYVQPVHKMGDFGKWKKGKGALHLRRTHKGGRTECLNEINTEFAKIAKKSIPMQKQFVSASLVGDKTTLLKMVRYRDHRHRTHADCGENGASSSIQEEEEEISACSWDAPLEGSGAPGAASFRAIYKKA